MSSMIGHTLGPYKLTSLLGTGSMGQVFQAVHAQTNRTLAIKILKPEVLAGLRPRLGKMLRTVAALDHPNIVRLYEYGEAGGHYYLAMEYVGDGSVRHLFQRRSEGRRSTLKQELMLVYQATQGLAHAHGRGLVHGNLIPDNLLLARKDAWYTVKIADFGLARLAQTGAMTATEYVLGTPAYMSPEQCQGLEPERRSDIYTLGILLYEAVTGYLPFDANTSAEAVYKHVSTPPVPPRRVRSDLPQRLEDIILRCLAKRPEDRFPDAESLGRALAEVEPGVIERAAQPLPAPSDDATVVFAPPAPPRPPQTGSAGPKSFPVVTATHRSGSEIGRAEVNEQLTIGRDRENDLVLPEGVVSLRHARVEWDGRQAAVTDLRSSNGTLLDGARLTAGAPQPWLPGQSLLIGPYQLSIAYPAARIEEDRTVVIPTPPVGPDVTIIEGAREREDVRGVPVIRVLDKSDAVIQTIPLHRALSIGREEGNDIVLPSGVVSLRHALVEWDGKRPTVTDLRSSNGTRLDETRLLPSAPQSWSSGQELIIGSYRLTLEMPEAESAPAPLMPEPMESDRISVTLDPTALTLNPGQPVVLRVTLANLGETVDHFRIEVEGAPEHWVKGPEQPTQLYPGSQTAVPLTVLAPREAASRAGVYHIRIRAHSKDRSWEYGSASGVWTVLPFEAAQLTLKPARVRSRKQGRFQATLLNLGNTPVDYALQTEDDERAIQFTVDQPALRAEPGERADATVTAARPRRWIGSPQTFGFKVSATPLGKGVPQLAAGQFVHQALIPPWLPPVAILVLLALAFMLFRWITRPPVIEMVMLEPTSPLVGQPVTVRWKTLHAVKVVFLPLGTEVDASEGEYPFEEGFLDPITLTLVARNRFNKTAEKPLQLAVTEGDAEEPVIDEWTISSDHIARGDPVFLRWRVRNAESVMIQPFGTETPEGERQDVPQQTKVYTLVATNRGKMVQRSLEVVVSENPPEVTRFTVEPNAMLQGEQSTVRLRWETRGATTVSIEPGIGSVGPRGSREIPAPLGSTTFELVAAGPGGEMNARAPFTVRDPSGGALAVKRVGVRVTPAVSETCPTTFTFFGTITSGTKGKVTYQWQRSDGAEPVVQEVTFDAPGSQVVRTTWTIGAPANQMRGWVQLNVLSPDPATSDPAAFTLNCPDVAAGTVAENCRTFDLDALQVSRHPDPPSSGQTWLLSDGSVRIKSFATEADARLAMTVIRGYRMTSLCTVGAPEPDMEYYLTSGRAPTGRMAQERCKNFNPSRLKVNRERRLIVLKGNDWMIVDGNREIRSFRSEELAKQGIALIRQHGFTSVCTAGSSNSEWDYFKK